MWHLSQTDHPLYNLIGAGDPGDRMLEVFKAVDRAIGEILASAPEDAHVLVFAAHGMGPNVLDVPSMTFLPEFLYRYSFPGKVGIADGKIGTPLQPPILECQKNSWLWEVWSTKHDSNPLRKWLRRNAPYRLFKRLEPFLGSSSQPDLISPFKLLEQGDPLYFQPATWYKPCWSKMTAFAIPSFSEGYIRLNVKGREAHGIVSPSDYEAVCDDICQKLNQLIDGRTGKPMVKEIIRIRQAAGDRDVRLPDADLVVLWKDDCPTDVVESPEFGRIGPVPHFRAGSHIPDGFLIAQGPGIEANSTLPAHSALDLTPTILSLMGAPIPDYFEGTPIFESAALPV